MKPNRQSKKLKLKKEIIKDLEVKGKGKKVKGGNTALCVGVTQTNCNVSCVMVCAGGGRR